MKKLTLSFATGGGCVEKMKMRMNNAPWHKYVCVDPCKYQTNLELSKCEAVWYVLVSLIVNTIAQRLGDSISVCEGL